MTEPEHRTGPSAAMRLAVLGGAVAVLVVAFVLLHGGRNDPQPSQQAASPAETTPQQTTSAPASTPAQPQATSEPTAAATTITVAGGRPVGGVQRLSFRRGDRIRFRVVADAADEAHVHGYDIEQVLTPGRPATFEATASIEGRFEVELHHAGVKIAEIEVTPS